MKISILIYLVVFCLFEINSQTEYDSLYLKIRQLSNNFEFEKAANYSKMAIEGNELDSLFGFFIDTDLINLRNSSYGLTVDSLLRKKYLTVYPTSKNPALGYELWKKGAEDQKNRSLQRFLRSPLPLSKNFDSIQKEKINRELFVWNNFKEYGVLTNSIVGFHGAKAAFLIIQHSNNHFYLSHYSKKMKQKIKSKELNPRWYALMKDRLRLKKGKRQIYGTQIDKINGITENGIFIEMEYAKLAPVKGNEKDINKKRKKIGMETLENDIVWELIDEVNKRVNERSK